MMLSARGLRAALVAASLLTAAGCGTPAASAPGSSTSAPLEVVVAFYPFQFIAERVGGDHTRVHSLTAPGSEPHDLELTPRQVGSLSAADLVVYERTFQPAVDEAVAQSGNDAVLDTATVVALQPAPAAEDGPAGNESAEHGEHEHSEGEGGLDPHVWLDPTNMASISAEVARRLADADPVHAADYAANAERLQADLGSLDQELSSGLAQCARTEFITTHAAFGYLARRYQLTQIGIAGLSPDAEPSPARIAAVQTEAADHGVTTIFYETLVSPAVAASIATDLGLQTDVLDPLEGITEESRGSDYLQVMRSNLAALEKANECR